MADSFRLGETWPDWWGDLVSAGKVITHNLDGRWAGGPDVAFMWTPSGIEMAQKGELITRRPDGHASVWRFGKAA